MESNTNTMRKIIRISMALVLIGLLLPKDLRWVVRDYDRSKKEMRNLRRVYKFLGSKRVDIK